MRQEQAEVSENERVSFVAAERKKRQGLQITRRSPDDGQNQIVSGGSLTRVLSLAAHQTG